MDIKEIAKGLKRDYLQAASMLNLFKNFYKMSMAIEAYDYNRTILACERVTDSLEKYLGIDKTHGNEYEFGHAVTEEMSAFLKIFIDAHFEKFPKEGFESRLGQLCERYEALKDRFPQYADRIKFEISNHNPNI